jgi:hypothetical protein
VIFSPSEVRVDTQNDGEADTISDAECRGVAVALAIHGIIMQNSSRKSEIGVYDLSPS